MSKKIGLFAVLFLIALAGLTFVVVYTTAETNLALAPAVEASTDFNYVQAAENVAFRWNAMAEANEKLGSPSDTSDPGEALAFRWNAMAEAHEKLGSLSDTSDPDEAMAYRWIAMARFYEKNDLLNELREHSDDSVAFRWVAMARYYEKNDLLTREPDLAGPSTLTVAAQGE